MLLEGALAVVVIIACCAGVGMGKFDRVDGAVGAGSYQAAYVEGTEQQLAGRAAWKTRYDSTRGWAAFGLEAKVGAFIEGGANFIAALGIPLELAIGIVAVLVASFAATTLDTATRLQRYVIQELAVTARFKPLTNKYAATLTAVVFAGALAMLPAPGGDYGTGGLILWPLFGATNQLLAGLSFLVLVFYLRRRKKPIAFALVPMLVMIVLPVWALWWQMFNAQSGWWGHVNPDTGEPGHNYLLFSIGLAVMALQVWMVVEAVLMWPRAKGVLDEELPPLDPQPALSGGRSC